MFQSLFGSLLNHLYPNTNENVSVRHLSLICITSIITTIYLLKNCSAYGRSCRIYSPKSFGFFRKEFVKFKKKNLFTGWGSVRMVKNCDLGLENATLGLRPRAVFSRPRSQFFTKRTSRPANNIYFFFLEGTVKNPANWLVLYPASIFLSLPTGNNNAFVNRRVYPKFRCHFS